MSHPPARIIDVLVVDDSPVVRHALKGIIEQEPGHRVLLAADPYEAVAVMSRTRPAAILLDVDMPRMDGLTFLKKLMRQHPLPVLLVTDNPERGVAALDYGACEVIAKPIWSDADGLAAWSERLRDSLREAVAPPPPPPPPARPAEDTRPTVQPRHEADVILPLRPYQPRGAPAQRIAVLGASTGGVRAIADVLAGMPLDSPGLAIVLHMPGEFTGAFADRLHRDPRIRVEVREARHNEPIRPGTALVVPGTSHGLIRRSADHYRVELVDGPPVCRHRPSVEVLFRSAAQAAGPHALGALLTGMGDDGAGGLREMRDAGSWTIAQDAATSVVFGMNREAILRGAARQVLPLDRVGPSIATWGRGLIPSSP